VALTPKNKEQKHKTMKTTNRILPVEHNMQMAASRGRLWSTAAAIFFAAALSNMPQESRGQSFNLQVPATSPWFDTGIDIVAGSQLNLTASGVVNFGVGASVNADGIGSGFDGTSTNSPFPTVYPNTIVLTLIGKVGGTTGLNTGTPVPEGRLGKGMGFVGTSYSQLIPTTGRLYLGFNDEVGAFDDNSGFFTVSGSIIPPLPQLSIQVADVAVCWDTRTNITYQLEYSSVLTTNQWMPLGLPISGSGSRTCVVDNVLGRPQRFYRLTQN
jgi:hypothetical protein